MLLLYALIAIVPSDLSKVVFLFSLFFYMIYVALIIYLFVAVLYILEGKLVLIFILYTNLIRKLLVRLLMLHLKTMFFEVYDLLS